MAYVLRFVQWYKPSHRQQFLALESKFQELERQSEVLPRGRRYQPLSGSEPTNSLIWECKFASLAEVQESLRRLADDPTHTVLFEQQAPYIVQMRTEILEELTFSE
jgi:hypothetical protein